MKIKLAKIKDASRIARLLKKYYEKDYKGYVQFTPNYIKSKMKNKGFFFIAENENRIIAVQRASIIDLDLAELRTLCVEEDYRRNGIARELIETAIVFLKNKKMRKVVARTRSDNKPIIKLLISLGFKKEGYFKEHFRKGTDIIQWYKFLNRI